MPTWMLSLKRGSPNQVDYIWLVNACFLTNCLAAFQTEPSLDLLRTSTSKPCPPYLAITSSVKPKSYLRVSSSTYQLTPVSPPSWRIKLHFLKDDPAP
ncbi:hypothetical protein CRENBAI_025792 [Crenichthys baileyi]|uniref:Uncharacterized protein n=1 Tax=Crenichthys baileyi TaxID=28760 RepID=A0AAV9SCU4_9TELE